MYTYILFYVHPSERIVRIAFQTIDAVLIDRPENKNKRTCIQYRLLYTVCIYTLLWLYYYYRSEFAYTRRSSRFNDTSFAATTLFKLGDSNIYLNVILSYKYSKKEQISIH